MKIHYRSHLRSYAQSLRKAGNLAEVLLWRELKAKKLGVQFVRQRPVGKFIVDFYCYTLRLASDIDGSNTGTRVYTVQQKSLLHKNAVLPFVKGE